MLSNMLSSLLACWRWMLVLAHLLLAEVGEFAGALLVLEDRELIAGIGVPSRPRISTGMLGPASSMGSPFSSSMARARP
jgi:hypothetical protein